jgi:hypothetical protein
MGIIESNVKVMLNSACSDDREMDKCFDDKNPEELLAWREESDIQIDASHAVILMSMFRQNEFSPNSYPYT